MTCCFIVGGMKVEATVSSHYPNHLCLISKLELLQLKYMNT